MVVWEVLPGVGVWGDGKAFPFSQCKVTSRCGGGYLVLLGKLLIISDLMFGAAVAYHARYKCPSI
jgi:hypothetical protein